MGMESSVLASLLGGVLIGVSALLLLWLGGRIAGVSGIVGGLLTAPADDRAWRVVFLLGLLLGGAVLLLVEPAALPDRLPAPWPVIALGGLLVGYGARARPTGAPAATASAGSVAARLARSSRSSCS
jgi:uncharacterized membrane protein YedE/YeeE